MSKEKSAYTNNWVRCLLIVFAGVVFSILIIATYTIYLLNVADLVTSSGDSNSLKVYNSAIDDVKDEKSCDPCFVVKTIATTVEGRNIDTYTFGDGENVIIFYGAMHGYEGNTAELLNLWIEYLNENPQTEHDDLKIVILPLGNPDGVAVPIRFNSNEVDINRNFDTPNWQKTTYFHEETYLNGGGGYPFSEIESRAIRDLVVSEKPKLIISYHSASDLVIPADVSTSGEYASIYSELSGYKYADPASDDNFEYSVTGTLENWASINGYSFVLVELASPFEHEYDRNLPAMLKMLEMVR